MKILVVEDDKNLNSSILEMLSQFGEIIPAYDGEEALYDINRDIYDLIILDIMLPKVSGLEVLTELRKSTNCPVIILTAKSAVDDKITGFQLGADDYLTKPFYRDELIARVSALLRRTNNTFVDLSLVFHDLRFDLQHHQVYYGNILLDINGKHYEILEYLVRNRNIIVTKEQVFNRIWGFESETVWSVVEVYVSAIRKVLKEYDYAKYIKTIRNVGYIWSE